MTRFRKWLIHKLGGVLLEEIPEAHFNDIHINTTHINFNPISVGLHYNKEEERLMPREEILQALNDEAAYEIGNALIDEKLYNIRFDYDIDTRFVVVNYDFLVAKPEPNRSIWDFSDTEE